MLFQNHTDEVDESNYSYIEPVPDWEMLAVKVGHGFVLFRVFGVVFLIIHVLCILLLPRFCRRHMNQRYHIIQMLTLAVCSICLGVCLTVDPYSRWHILPIFVNNILEQVADPCVIVGFFCMQNSVINLASINISWNKLQSHGRLYGILFVYIASVLVFEAIVVHNTGLNIVRLMTKLQLVVFSIYSCTCFLCTGFKAAIYLDFVKSPNKLKNALLEHQTETEGDSKSLLTHSSDKATVNLNASIKQSEQSLFRSVYSSTESSDSDTDKSVKHKSRKTKHRRPTLQQHKGNDFGIKLKHFRIKKSPKINFSSSDIQHSVGLNGNSQCNDERGQTRQSKIHVYEKQAKRILNHSCSTIGVNNKVPVNSSDSADTSQTVLVERGSSLHTLCKKGQQTTESDSQAYDSTNETSDGGSFTQNADDNTSNYNNSTDDNGYLADGEHVIMPSSTKQTDQDGDSIYSHFTDVQEQSFNSMKGSAMAMPASCSLVRLRQCIVLQRLVTVAYFVTFTLVVNTVFHLYSIFGVYGIFGTHRTPKPWPWFMFQLLHRLVEVLLTSSLLVAMLIVLWYRPRRKKNQLQKSNA